MILMNSNLSDRQETCVQGNDAASPGVLGVIFTMNMDFGFDLPFHRRLVHFVPKFPTFADYFLKLNESLLCLMVCWNLCAEK